MHGCFAPRCIGTGIEEEELKTIDKSSLSKNLIEKQKLKGTFDSPCMSVCNYNDSLLCQTCKMYKYEKQEWKVSDEKNKNKILSNVLGRSVS